MNVISGLEAVSETPVYDPAGTFTIATGIVVADKWLNSTFWGVESTKMGDPLLGISVMGPMFSSNEVTRSAGASPILNCATELAAATAFGVFIIVLLLYLAQPWTANNGTIVNTVYVNFSTIVRNGTTVDIVRPPQLNSEQTECESPRPKQN